MNLVLLLIVLGFKWKLSCDLDHKGLKVFVYCLYYILTSTNYRKKTPQKKTDTIWFSINISILNCSMTTIKLSYMLLFQVILKCHITCNITVHLIQ